MATDPDRRQYFCLCTGPVPRIRLASGIANCEHSGRAFRMNHLERERQTIGKMVEIYYQREMHWAKAMAEARIVDKPFWFPSRRSATPPAPF